MFRKARHFSFYQNEKKTKDIVLKVLYSEGLNQ